MAAAKRLKLNPRELAQKVVDALDLKDIADEVSIAGPGFINIRLSPAFLAKQTELAFADTKLGVPMPAQQKVMVEYSSPNLAKEMHVGHLRSTIIGDALARIMQFLGHEVITQNHVGDWGTQFGMLIAHFLEVRNSGSAEFALTDLEAFYREAKKRFDAEPEFANLSRDYVVRLQGGDTEVLALWQQFLAISMEHCDAVYRKLGVLLDRDSVRGESAYNDDLPKVVADLATLGMLQESEGAQCVFLDEFKNKEGAPLPLIVQKSDGGYLYASTDLAAIRYRTRSLQLDRVLYVVDVRQGLHFQQVFGAAKKAGFAPAAMSLEHIAFGTMLGEDGKPFKTRSGDLVKLVELLEEAENRAFEVVSQKNPDLDESRRREIAHTVGIAAVKYADLSKNRTGDYVFSWDTMLALDGNTAPYLQYAHARICSILRKAEVDFSNASVALADPAERNLALELARFGEVVHGVGREAMPHLLAAYLYGLSGQFMRFYEACPVLKAEPAISASRLKLSALTAKILAAGLNMLGIEAPESM